MAKSLHLVFACEWQFVGLEWASCTDISVKLKRVSGLIVGKPGWTSGKRNFVLLIPYAT